MKKMLFAAGLAVVSFASVWGFGFNDIRCWIGEGTNRCAVVVDFNDGGTGDRSFAWGYRWNGDAPSVKAILDAITIRDSRLKMFSSSSQYGSYIEAFAYDADADGGTFERVWNNEAYAYDFVKSDADDIFPATEDVYSFDPVTSNHVYTGVAWMQLAGTGTAFEDVAFADTPNGVDYTNPEDGQWICWRLCPYESVSDYEWNPVGYECIETSPYVPVAAVRAFSMDSIRYWVGHGTNSCAIVIDFNDNSAEKCSFAWGYRWNGEAPSVKSILDEITTIDRRLKMFASASQYGSFIEAFAYDVDGDGGTFEISGNSYAYDFVKSDADDLFPATVSESSVDPVTGNYVYSGTSWMQLAGTGFMFDDVAFAETPNGVDFTNPEDGAWICWRLCPYVSEYDSNWEIVGYECTIDSEYLPSPAEPRLVADGTITKSNTKSGQTATWKAVAAPGSVFSHWKGGIVDTLGLSANALRNPTLKFKMPAELEEPTAVFVPIDADGISALWLEGDQPLEAGVLVTNLFLRDDSLSYVTATVKGLPAGMRFNAADLSFGGKPKKDGTYVLTVTAKNASGYQMSQALKLSVGAEDPSVEVPEIAYTPYYPLSLTVADGGGTVKGTGVYAANKAVTASAVADKGYVFAGWFTDETCTVPATVGGLDYRTSTVKVSVPDVRYLVAKFVKKGADTDPVANLACAGVDESGSLTMMVGVRVDASVAITCDSLSLPSYSSKSFPAGVSVSKTTGEIVGVPTKAGTFNAQVVVSNASEKRTLPLTINVLPLPEWANGSFIGLVEQQDAEPGSATLTVGKTGKISGKVELCGTNWTFSASAYDAVQFADGTTNLMITGEAKYVDAKKNASVRDIALSVNMPTNGTWNIATVTGSFGDAEYGAYRVIWSDSKLAKDELSANWTGTYLYATDAGDILTLKIQNNGSVTFAGTLANGRSVKGSTSLLHEDAALIRSPFAIAYAPAASVKVKVDKKTETVFCPAFCDIIRFKYDAPEPGGPAVRR